MVMVNRRKWNPQTGRFEIQDGGNNTIDFNNPFGLTPSTTAAPAKKSKPNQGPVAPSTTSTTAPKSTTTTMPKATTTTTTAPKATTTTTVAPKPKTTPKVSTPTGPSFRQAEQAGNAAYNNWSEQQAQSALADLFGTGFDINSLAGLLGSGGGGAGGKNALWQYKLALEQAKTANAIAAAQAGYTGGMEAATAQEQAGQQARSLYEQLGNTGYQTQMADIQNRFAPQFEAMNKYYDTQTGAAQQKINDAAQQALANIQQPTAYQGLQSALLTAPTQNLGLGAYGATGQLAQQQSEMDANTAKFLSDLVNRSYGQTQAANMDYNTALKNAITGTQAGSLQNLTNLTTALRAQDQSGLRQQEQAAQTGALNYQQQMLLEGIKALIAGQQNAAATRASTLANYGAYAPKTA